MKSCKLAADDRKLRSGMIAIKREATIREHLKRGRSFIQSNTTRKVFGKKSRLTGKVTINHDQRPYPHSSARQRARYARQIAAGQLNADV